jgi:uncharacterized protein YegP (UPF0339 family)
VLVSPWIDPGVESRRLQHTSVLATVKKMFGLPSFLTKRDASAATFDDLFTLRTAPRDDTPQTLPRADLPEVSSDPEDPSSPGNARIDNTQQQVNEGLHMLTSHGHGSQAMPSTQHEASLHLQRRISDYLKRQKARKKTQASFRIAKDARGGYRWQLLGTDGKPVAASAQSYPTKAASRKAATSLSDLAGNASIVEAEAAAPSRKPRKAAPAKKSKAAPAKKKQKR